MAEGVKPEKCRHPNDGVQIIGMGDLYDEDHVKFGSVGDVEWCSACGAWRLRQRDPAWKLTKGA